MTSARMGLGGFVYASTYVGDGSFGRMSIDGMNIDERGMEHAFVSLGWRLHLPDCSDGKGLCLHGSGRRLMGRIA
eukprot:2194030-Karenia_brevis.AAC.1